MTKQEEIRNGLIDFLDRLENPYTDEDDRPRGHVDDLLEYLDSKGCVLKAERGLPPLMPESPNNEWSAGYCCGEEFYRDVLLEAGYVATMPLVEDKNECR